MPSLPELGNLPDLPALSTASAQAPGTPTEIYTRIARGALNCWFGADGPLKGDYIYHAEADPPSKGGKSEIAIRTRDPTAQDPRSLKAFRIGIVPGPERTDIDVENFKIPEPLAARLKDDVKRWAADQEGCGTSPLTTGWGTAESAASAAKKGPAKSKR